MPAPAAKRNNRTMKSPEQVVKATSGRSTGDLPAVADVTNDSPTSPELNTEEVARLAYFYWEARGRDGGSAEEDWLRAEQELRTRKSEG